MMDKEETPLKQIRTFQGDVAEALEKQRESLVSIQRAEQLKKSSSGASNTPEITEKRKQFFYLLVGSFFFLILGIVGAWYAYNEFLRKTATPEIALPENRFISANTEMRIDVLGASRETLISSLTGATEGVPRGELKHVVLNKILGEEETELLTTSEFFKALESQAPGNLVRAFEPLFMYGALGESAFLIIKLASFENAFAGMLNWEKNLSQDIGPLFATRGLLRSLPLEPVFSDVTDRNKDIRMLSLENQTVLLYSFFGNDILIITDNLETLRTLIDRLTQEKLSR